MSCVSSYQKRYIQSKGKKSQAPQSKLLLESIKGECFFHLSFHSLRLGIEGGDMRTAGLDIVTNVRTKAWVVCLPFCSVCVSLACAA